MTNILALGAINKITGKYVHPKLANKKDKYICPECNKNLILCQGEIRVHHFRHKVDNVNPCHYYSNPNETQIHKDAKILLKNILERKIKISFIRNCYCCKYKESWEIPEISKTSLIELEYRFEYNGVKVADVAYIDDCEIVCIFEIYNTHKTISENRPEPWFEINAKTLISSFQRNILKMYDEMNIQCIRCEKCNDCIEKEKFLQQEKEKYKNAITEINNLSYRFKNVVTGDDDLCLPTPLSWRRLHSSNYENKFKLSKKCRKTHRSYKITGDSIMIKCDKFLSEIIKKFKNKIYIKQELEKTIFNKCYYSKYYRTIQKIKKYGSIFNSIGTLLGETDWCGWSNGKVDGCERYTIYKFIKHYNLINPMNMEKHLQKLFAN
tara:strand:- start:111 stop:1250 length:1140 start_codon:yes stop_codon:yes gene_type:complete